MSSNKLIVESKNDQYFLQAIIRYLNLNIEVAPPIIISENDYKTMDGLDSAKLTIALNDLKADIQKGEVEKVGIVIDVDNEQEIKRIDLINQFLQEAFPDSPPLTRIKTFIDVTVDDCNIQLSCYLTNVNGEGELETLLKKIKKEDSTYADCLESWKNCLEAKGETISMKEFNKFWISNYLRFDTCSKEEKKQAGSKCSMGGFKYVMEEKARIWDFEHSALNDLKDFLQMFC